MKLGKLHCISIIPLFPIAVLIDILFGDYVTGTKTTIMEKLRLHKKVFMNTWNGI